jgi:membrane-bound inhibitor of C-type lysozyme
MQLRDHSIVMNVAEAGSGASHQQPALGEVMTRLATLAAALLLGTSAAALAQEAVEVAPPPAPPTATATLSIALESTSDIERIVSVYQCSDGQALTVQYINAAPNFLAILPVNGQNQIFATTLSGSGARYVSGPYEWWSKGDEATLRDLMQDEDAAPLATCGPVNNTP